MPPTPPPPAVASAGPAAAPAAAPAAQPAAPAARRAVDPALVVILAGVCAALHVGKLPPAIPPLQAALGITLVQAGFLLAVVQAAGMTAGVAFGALADGLTPRRSMLLGLAVLAVASGGGGFAEDVLALMVLRAAEGFGFLLVVLAAPALIRRLVAPERLNLALGLWGAYMPLGTTLALLAGPWVIEAAGWRLWWWALAAVSAAMALWLAREVPRAAAAAVPAAAAPGAAAPPPPSLPARLARTLASRGPWLLAAAFGVYSGQWLAVIGFLPTIYAQGGTALGAAGLLTAAAAAANMVGNIGAGRLLHAGVQPERLLYAGYAVMAACALLAFVVVPGAAAEPAQPLLPPAARFVAVLLFSGVGGLVPATLFALAVRVAPGEGTLSTTVGWMQQGSAIGQFAGPPLVAWVAGLAGGWHLTWLVTGACSLTGLALGAALARHLKGAGAAIPLRHIR
ncbi:MAG: MFS transporter [Rubrivivax sp.]|nr:MFS transporter [Rubrivivax sp.]